MPAQAVTPLPLLADHALVRRAQSGREDCLAYLLTSDGRIRGLIRSLRREVDPFGVVPRDEMEAVARLAALEALRRFRPDLGARFSTFVYWPMRGAMIRVAIAYGSARPESLDTGYDCVDVEAEEQMHAVVYDLDRAREARAIREFVERLPSAQRTIVHAVFWQKRSHGEIAAERGISRQAVSKTLAKALARGRRDLAAMSA